MSGFPTPDMALTHILGVTDLERSTAWYRDVPGAGLYGEYGSSSAVFAFNGTGDMRFPMSSAGFAGRCGNVD